MKNGNETPMMIFLALYALEVNAVARRLRRFRITKRSGTAFQVFTRSSSSTYKINYSSLKLTMTSARKRSGTAFQVFTRSSSSTYKLNYSSL